MLKMLDLVLLCKSCASNSFAGSGRNLLQIRWKINSVKLLKFWIEDAIDLFSVRDDPKRDAKKLFVQRCCSKGRCRTSCWRSCDSHSHLVSCHLYLSAARADLVQVRCCVLTWYQAGRTLCYLPFILFSLSRSNSLLVSIACSCGKFPSVTGIVPFPLVFFSKFLKPHKMDTRVEKNDLLNWERSEREREREREKERETKVAQGYLSFYHQPGY